MLVLERAFLALSCLGAFLYSVAALAEEQADPRDLICALIEVYECGRNAQCDPVDPVEIAAPRFMRIDFKNRATKAVGPQASGRSSTILSLTRLGDRIILQGVDGGVEGARAPSGWTASLSAQNLVLTAAGEDAAFVAFGECFEPE